jgi:hypothetical protein
LQKAVPSDAIDLNAQGFFNDFWLVDDDAHVALALWIG